MKNLEEASRGIKVLLEPFDVDFAVVGFYETEDSGKIGRSLLPELVSAGYEVKALEFEEPLE